MIRFPDIVIMKKEKLFQRIIQFNTGIIFSIYKIFLVVIFSVISFLATVIIIVPNSDANVLIAFPWM